MFDGSTEIVSDYKEWIAARYRGTIIRSSSMSDVHEEIVVLLNKSGLSLNEIATLLAGVLRSYCVDSIDARGAAELFADEMQRMIGDDDYDDDGEMVNRTDAGGD